MILTIQKALKKTLLNPNIRFDTAPTNKNKEKTEDHPVKPLFQCDYECGKYLVWISRHIITQEQKFQQKFSIQRNRNKIAIKISAVYPT